MNSILMALPTLLASAVATVTGFGTSTIMVPVLVSFLSLPQTLLLVGIVHWFGDIWKMLLFRQGVRWRLVLLFGIPGIVMSIVGGLSRVPGSRGGAFPRRRCIPARLRRPHPGPGSFQAA